MTTLPSRARIVIIGGGVIGASVAYHLTEAGEEDVVLIEQGELSCGTTWHAAGLVGQLRATESATRLVQYSTDLYARLEAETGLSSGFKQCGGVTVARTEDRMNHLRRTAATAEAFDMECEILTPEAAREHYPLMDVDDLVGAIWLPDDGKANPTDLTLALAKGARQRGARVVEHVRVTEVLVEGGGVIGVQTDHGDIGAEIVVNCAGQWANDLAARIGVTVPLHSAEHFYVVTDQIEGVHRDLPILRDPDGYTYFKEEVGGLVVGGFEPEAKPWVSPDQIPHPFEFQLLEEDWDHFAILMDSALERVPALRETGIRKFYNGPESFTPDNQFILGEAPSVQGLLRRRRVQLGRHRDGRRGGAGPGRVDHRGRADQRPGRRRHPALRPVQRQPPLAPGPGRRGARACTTRSRGRTGSSRPPDRSAAPRCTSDWPTANAGFGSKMGWERANYFAPAGAGSGDRVLLGPSELVPVGGGRAARHPDGGRGVRPDVVLEVPGHRRRRRGSTAVDLHQRRRRRGRPYRLHGVAQRARHVRVGPDRHPRVDATSSCWSAARPPPSATRTGSGGTSRRATTPTSSTSPRRWPSSASWVRDHATCCPA